MATIILDAGHGGNDLGAAYGYRYEKNDNLKLTLEVGKELEKYGYNVEYTRIIDTYLSQLDRVKLANNVGGDFLLTLHRITGELGIVERCLEFYINERGGIAEEAAINIGNELLPLGFCSYSVEVRSELPILSDVNMPSLMISIGQINSEADNIFFDTRLNDIAAAIALGIYNTIPVDSSNNLSMSDNETNENQNQTETVKQYGVQVGLFSNFDNAIVLRDELLKRGYMVQIVYKEPYYAVIVGAFDDLDIVSELEFRLRLQGYDTIVVELL